MLWPHWGMPSTRQIRRRERNSTMAHPRHLSRAPITEALIDFRVKAHDGFQPAEFMRLKDSLGPRFPKVQERRGLKATILPQQERAELTNLGLHGLFFQSEDDKTVAQFRIDGFTLNRLRPYTSWDELLPVVMELWNNYCDVAQPEYVARLALRYLNRIELPATTVDFGHYITKAPELPPEVPPRIRRFVSRVTVEDENTGLSAHIGQTLEQDADSRIFALLLDVDAFREERFDPSDPRIRDVLGALRDLKNTIFFSLITEETAGMFE